MDNATALNSKAPAVRIGIRGLTHTKSMMGGSIYILIAETTSARFPMLAGSIAGAFEDGLLCTLIVPGNTTQFIQRIERLARINTAELVSTNRLQIFMTQDNFLKKMFQFGADRFVSELEDFGVSENSYLIFDQADELLSLHDISLAQDQINVLKEWFTKKGITVLLVFSRFTDAHNNTVNAIMDSLGGIVRLGGAREGLELKFDYWQSPTSVIAAKNYQIETLDTGLYKASTKISAPDTFTDDQIQDEDISEQSILERENSIKFVGRQATADLGRYRGYIKPPEFIQEINRMLNQVRMPSTMMVGAPSMGMIMGDIVRRFDRSSRLGELISADDSQCYIYLNIDSKSIFLENLEIILGIPVDAIFSHYRILNSAEEIRLELEAISYSVKLRSYPDFSYVHEIAVPKQISRYVSKSDQNFADHFSAKSIENKSAFNNIGDSTAESDKFDDAGFELAKRSVSLDPSFVSQESSIGKGHKSVGSDTQDEILFDLDIEIAGPIFEKKEAPRAKRSLN